MKLIILVARAAGVESVRTSKMWRTNGYVDLEHSTHHMVSTLEMKSNQELESTSIDMEHNIITFTQSIKFNLTLSVKFFKKQLIF